jgi:hypothetical protein
MQFLQLQSEFPMGFGGPIGNSNNAAQGNALREQIGHDARKAHRLLISVEQVVHVA